MNTMNISMADDEQYMGNAAAGGQSLQYSVGTMIKGTVLGIGEQASVAIGDRKIKVSPEVLKNRKAGDEMEFMVSSVEEQSVVLKAMQSVVGAAGVTDERELLSNTSRLEVMRNTEQFVHLAEESDIRIEEADEVCEDARETAKLSSEDLAMLRRLGIDVANADISHLLGLVNQFHAQQEGRSFQTGSAEVVEAIAMAQNLDKLSEGAMRYLLEQELPFTYDNVYKAEFSAAGSFMAEGMTDAAWQQLQPQLAKLFTSEGLSDNEDNEAAARWLLEQQLDVTAKNIEYYQDMLAFNEDGISAEEYSRNVIASLMLGETAGQAQLIGVGIARQAQEQEVKLSKVRREDIDFGIRMQRLMNLSTLFELSAARQRESGTSTGEAYKENEMLTGEAYKEGMLNGAFGSGQTANPEAGEDEMAERQNRYWQLEQLRLRMTLQSGYQLLKQNPNLLQLDMKEVIKELDALDALKNRSLFRDSRVELTEGSLSLYQETMTKTAIIPRLPAMALGQWSGASEALTLNMMFRQGMELSMNPATAALSEGGEHYYETISGKLSSYESMMTAPRSDMGDSIQKAFANMDSLLGELGMELSAENKKAVRILSYNQMELTDEAVEQIKELDSRLVSVLNRMKPEVVLGMIRDGVNPLRMELSELEAELSGQEQKQGRGSDEKFSEFLYRMEQRGEITDAERESYIGVYRLLNAVTGHSGRDLGAVVRNDESVTLEHLLRAHRSRGQHGTDVSIGEDVEFLTASGGYNKDIISQLETAFAEMKQKQLFDNEADETVEDTLLEEQQEQLRDLSETGREAALLLQSVELPYTPANLLASEQLMNHSGEFYESIRQELKQRGQQSRQPFDDLEQRLYERMEQLERQQSEDVSGAGQTERSVLSEQAMTIQQIYEYAFSSAFHEMDTDSTFTARDLLAAGQIHTRMRVAAAMEQQQDYVVPVMLEDEVLTMTVHFDWQGTQKKGFTAQVETEKYGVITADLRLGKAVDVTLSCKEQAGQEAIREGLQTFVSMLSTFSLTPEQVQITTQPVQNALDHYLGEPQETLGLKPQEAKAFGADVSGAMLYDAAKAFVALIRSL